MPDLQDLIDGAKLAARRAAQVRIQATSIPCSPSRWTKADRRRVEAIQADELAKRQPQIDLWTRKLTARRNHA